MIPNAPKPIQGTRRRIHDAIANRLKDAASPLARLVNTWQLARGEAVDQVEPAEWVETMLPVLRFELIGGPGNWQNQSATKYTMTARITLGLAGTDQRDALDWWEAVERQLMPDRGNDWLGPLNLLGVNSLTISLAAITRQTYADGIGQVVTGNIAINHELMTRY